MKQDEWNRLKERVFRDFPDLCWVENVKMRRSMGERYGADEDPPFGEDGENVGFPWVVCNDPCAPLCEMFGLCGCGDPESVIRKYYLPFLRAIWINSGGKLPMAFEKEPMSFDKSAYRYFTRCTEKLMNAILSGKLNPTQFEVVDDPTLELLILYSLDRLGLAEHGTSITYCWLTPRGETALAMCEAIFEYEKNRKEK